MRTPILRTNPFAVIAPLAAVEVDERLSAVERQYIQTFGPSPEDRGGWLHADDWRRVSFVLNGLRPGGRFLDVGLGAGQFINAVAAADLFDEVHGCDLYRFNKYIEFGGPIERVDASVAELPFPDDHFDVVTCMEVLEHLPDEIYEAGLSELRRVCGGQLVMSVPYCEPEPIFDGHRRRFEATDLVDTFPDADRTLLFRWVTPWALMEEWHGPPGASAPSPKLSALGLRHRSKGPRTARIGAALGPRIAHRVAAVARRLRR